MKKQFALALFTLAACTDTADDVPEVKVTSEELVFDQGFLWTKDDLTVCWDESAYDDPETDAVDDIYASQRIWVRDIVVSNWSRLSRLELTGWGRCTQTPNPDSAAEAQEAGRLAAARSRATSRRTARAGSGPAPR